MGKKSDVFCILLAALVIFVTGCAKPLASIITDEDGVEMVLIPAGEFIMGSSEDERDDGEHPQHKVYLDAFYIDKYEVTNAQYKRFMEATGHNAPSYWGDENYNQPNLPVTGVSWHDAVAYAKWAKKRLPTEAEWEKAARGTDGREYPWGNEWVDSRCNTKISDDGYGVLAPVGSFPGDISPYGVIDMAGNVSEWVHDWSDRDYYSRSPKRNPKGPEEGIMRTLRGGNWDNAIEHHMRCATRDADLPVPSGWNLRMGFRCARDVPEH